MNADETLHTFEVEERASVRLDRFLTDRLSLSRTGVVGLIGEGRVLVNGEPAKKRYVPQAGDRIEVRVPSPTETALEPEDIAIEIRHDDPHLASKHCSDVAANQRAARTAIGEGLSLRCDR